MYESSSYKSNTKVTFQEVPVKVRWLIQSLKFQNEATESMEDHRRLGSPGLRRNVKWTVFQSFLTNDTI